MTAVATTLRAAAERIGLRIGSAFSFPAYNEDSRYAAVLAREFNCVTAENEMKPMFLQPERGRFDFSTAERLLDFAGEQDMAVRGHTLVWHNQMPLWLRQGGFSRLVALEILRDHVQQVCAHFRGRVWCWDVVNEALNDDGGWREKSPWFQMTQTEYIERAFVWAHEADPEALLFYNDYGMELAGAKGDACYRMLRDFLDRGVPVHGVGFQGHLGVENRLDDAFANQLRRFRDLGLAVHITEMDMGLPCPVTDEARQQQAEEYARRFRLALAAGVSAIVLWGFTDRYSWVPSFSKGAYDEALLFDREYQPKPAWQSVLNLLKEAGARSE